MLIGGAGVFGAGTYSLLTQCGVTPRMAVLLMLFVPVGMFFTYFFLIKVNIILGRLLFSLVGGGGMQKANFLESTEISQEWSNKKKMQVKDTTLISDS